MVIDYINKKKTTTVAQCYKKFVNLDLNIQSELHKENQSKYS